MAMRILHLIGILGTALTVALTPLQAAEFAVLRSGFRLQADRHEVHGDKVRLFSNGGVTELPLGSVVQFEVEDAVATPPPPVPTRTVGPAPAPVVPPSPPTTPSEFAAHAARKFALPEGFVRSVMKAESGFQPAARSPKGAIGLMQLMPATARELGVDPRDPKQNAEGGTQYLRDLLSRYEHDPDQVLLALAAYNAGPGAVQKYHGVPPYRETREYILRVLKNWDRKDDRP
jgi:hypothetical protein